MALTPGIKLGPYEIQSPLGAGGMVDASSQPPLAKNREDGEFVSRTAGLVIEGQSVFPVEGNLSRV